MAAELPTVTTAELRRTVLARQLLTTRVELPIPEAVSRVASLQAQYAPSMYVGLWSRLHGLCRDDLTAALAARDVVQGTMMRATIHLAAASDYWPLNLAIRDIRRSWYRRVRRVPEDAVLAAAARTRDAFERADVLTRKELDAVAGDERSYVGLYVDLVRVPPSGTWERRRADHYALAERWVGPEPDLSTEEALRHLVRHYLSGFGPASAAEIANWAGATTAAIKAVLPGMSLVQLRAEDGTVLLDRADLGLAPPSTPLPVRFLGTWEALLLVHARRTRILAEEDRPLLFTTKAPQSFNPFLVGGTVRGTWRHVDGEVVVDPWRPLTPDEHASVDAEAERLAAFVA